ncbi:MAG: Fic family protein [Spirochaetaceae bacterium]|nr:Fic family protein [Spirochaetaceae bacterium]
MSEKTFSFSPPEYLSIHKRLFAGIYKFAGRIRDYNITKSEWVLDGETVLYGTAENLKETLEYDFNQEKNFNYSGLTQEEAIEHIAHFAACLWQIHVFGQGNTRTTAVFLIKYLRHLGFKNVNNDLFAEHSWYFRNALVRANF